MVFGLIPTGLLFLYMTLIQIILAWQAHLQV
jgi:hypothetical protein